MPQIPKAPFFTALVFAIPFALITTIAVGLTIGLGASNWADAIQQTLLNFLIVWVLYLLVYFVIERLFHLRRHNYLFVIFAFPLAIIIALILLTIFDVLLVRLQSTSP